MARTAITLMNTKICRLKKRWEKVLFLAGSLLLTGFKAFSFEYEVDGIATIAPASFAPFHCSMQIYVKDCHWEIYWWSENSSNRFVNVLSDDGENIYKLTRIETNVGTSFARDDYSHVIPYSWVGEIHPSGFPYRMLAPEPITMFYAYASSCYLASVTNKSIGSIMLDPKELDLGYEQSPVELQRGNLPPQLPTSIQFLDQNAKRIIASFNSSNFTNVGEIQLPLDVSFVRFYDGSTNVHISYTFHVAKMSDKCRINSFVPFIPKTAIILDYRFSHQKAEAIPVLVTNAWPTLSQSKTVPVYYITHLNTF